ncbi:BNR-4 repeat-containing protein [Wenyingzhuangia sp. IMCC45574]
MRLQNVIFTERLYKTLIVVFFLFSITSFSQVVLENEIKITDTALFFDGSKVPFETENIGDSYDYFFGNKNTVHGDCVKSYEQFIFMTWYRGGKEDRHVMLTRYNTITGTQKTIEFPHRHTGYLNKWWIGESHNSIAIGISPLDGTIHMIYDMHAYSRTKPTDGSFSNDYFRYSFSKKNAASVSDDDFTLDQFIKNTSGGYKHLGLNAVENYSAFSALTYPQFFLNNLGDLFVYIREGGNNNGAYKFSKYDAATSTWSDFTHFNVLNAKSKGESFNWGLYGNMKYVNGKIRVGFQRRSANNNDKYLYQNGVYYAYSDDQTGATDWKNHKGETFNLPLLDADKTKVVEPGDFVTTTAQNKVYIVGGFDWTVTENGDEHIISQVRDNENNVTKNLHTYRKAGASDFVTTSEFSGGSELYTYAGNVYLIGLNNGYVFVEKATGGTNNFSRIYQATSGRRFNHGVVYISKGKLYYYLMERATSGSARATYLQVIDLGIDFVPFRTSIQTPVNGATYNVGQTVKIEANAIDESGGISKVEFLVNNTVIGEATAAPYAIDWLPTTEGEYTLQVVAYNNSNEMLSSNEVKVNLEIKDPLDLTGDVYRIKNYVTGKYLHSVGSDVVESSDRENEESGDKEWEFVTAGDYFNIESKRGDRGILRAAGNPANDIINTGFGAPREDSDKQFVISYNSTDKTYQFKTRNNANYLYHSANGVIEHIANTDDRSKWIVESTTLSNEEIGLDPTLVALYPNPASDTFTIVLSKGNKATVSITDVLGKQVYQTIITSGKVKIYNNGQFSPGLYLIKIVDEHRTEYYSKLVIR